MKTIKEPKIIENLLDRQDYLFLKKYFSILPKPESSYVPAFGRYALNDQILDIYFKKLLPKAREYFESDTLECSYAIFAHYEGPQAKLWRHKDDNACTYTFDMCIYQSGPWDLFVDGKPYTLKEGDTLAYYGEDQEHWREDFPYKDKGYVAMAFFHFVEPDHWFFTKNKGIGGPGKWGPDWPSILNLKNNEQIK